jgi:hypothetical protein
VSRAKNRFMFRFFAESIRLFMRSRYRLNCAILSMVVTLLCLGCFWEKAFVALRIEIGVF